MERGLRKMAEILLERVTSEDLTRSLRPPYGQALRSLLGHLRFPTDLIWSSKILPSIIRELSFPEPLPFDSLQNPGQNMPAYVSYSAVSLTSEDLETYAGMFWSG